MQSVHGQFAVGVFVCISHKKTKKLGVWITRNGRRGGKIVKQIGRFFFRSRAPAHLRSTYTSHSKIRTFSRTRSHTHKYYTQEFACEHGNARENVGNRQRCHWWEVVVVSPGIRKSAKLELMELENIVANTVYLKAREGTPS